MRPLLRAFVVLAFVALAAPVAAQTHPCSQPEQTTATKGTKVGWCIPAEDLTGVTWSIKVNGTTVSNWTSLSPIGAPDAVTGLYYLEATLPTTYSKGLYNVTVFGKSIEGTGLDSDIKVWQVGGPPAKPKNTRITGS